MHYRLKNGIRRVFYSGNRAQGGGRLPLERQADATCHPDYRRFVESVRWQAQGVLFVGANVPGSNNHSGGPGSPQTVKVPGQDAEWALRNAARGSFRVAKATRARAVFLLWQGDPDLENRRPELPRYDSNGFRDLVSLLLDSTETFGRPMMLAHGDAHQGFRMDRPLPRPNFLRVENYGHPNTHWTKVTLVPGRTDLERLRFEGMPVPGTP
jgi:hypothetical protein